MDGQRADNSDIESITAANYRPPVMRAIHVLGGLVGLLWAASLLMAVVRYEDRVEVRFDLLALFLIVVFIDQRLEIRWLRLHPEAR